LLHDITSEQAALKRTTSREARCSASSCTRRDSAPVSASTKHLPHKPLRHYSQEICCRKTPEKAHKICSILTGLAQRINVLGVVCPKIYLNGLEVAELDVRPAQPRPRRDRRVAFLVSPREICANLQLSTCVIRINASPGGISPGRTPRTSRNAG
jgi:hypothetical protein